jgi:hypothetical protein
MSTLDLGLGGGKELSAAIPPPSELAEESIAHDLGNLFVGIRLRIQCLRGVLPGDSPVWSHVESLEELATQAVEICALLQDEMGVHTK